MRPSTWPAALRRTTPLSVENRVSRVTHSQPPGMAALWLAAIYRLSRPAYRVPPPSSMAWEDTCREGFAASAPVITRYWAEAGASGIYTLPAGMGERAPPASRLGTKVPGFSASRLPYG